MNQTIPGLDSQDITLLQNARNYHYARDMILQIRKNECSFCQLDPNKNKVIFDLELWHTWTCPPQFMAKSIEKHFVIAPKRHITHIKDMTGEDWADLAGIANIITEEQDIDGGALLMRFGNPAKNAQSMRHLHCNIYVPDGTGEVKLTIAKDPAKIAKKKLVVACWIKMFQLEEAREFVTGEHSFDDKKLAENCLSNEEYALVEPYFV